MSETIKVTINDHEVFVPEGTNLIDAAEMAGIHIPNLCYLKGMRGIGACRMCLVEVEGMKAPMIACTTKVKDGMVVRTDSEHLRELRRFIIDLILSMHPLDCMTCTKAGACTLQKYAYELGIKESSFSRKKFGHSIDDANPFIKREPDYCILCGRCVRICKEQGTSILDFMGRGVGAKVTTAKDIPLQDAGCTFCGSCIDVCPVNAIVEADRWQKAREWECKRIDTVCLSCGNACAIRVSTSNGSIVKVNSSAPDGSAEKYICAIGRFGFDALLSDTRITVPMKKMGDGFQAISWQEAIDIISERLSSSKDIGIITTGDLVNQDAFVLARFASDVLKTENVDTTVSLYADPESMKFSDRVDIDEADLIMVVGLDPDQYKRVLPALDAVVRKRASRGAKLIVINSSQTVLGLKADISIKDDEIIVLSRIAKALIEKGKIENAELNNALSDISTDEESQKVEEMISGATYPVIFCHPSLFGAARNLKLITDIKVVAVPYEANARGVIAMGLVQSGKSIKEMLSGSVNVLYAVGQIPSETRPDVDFIVAQASYLTGLAEKADIVLPAATYLESDGTIIDYTGRVRDLNRVINPIGNAKQHRDIFIELSKAMNSPIKESFKDIKSAHEVGKLEFRPFNRKEGLDTDSQRFIESTNEGILKHSRLLWLTEVAEKV